MVKRERCVGKELIALIKGEVVLIMGKVWLVKRGSRVSKGEVGWREEKGRLERENCVEETGGWVGERRSRVGQRGCCLGKKESRIGKGQYAQAINLG